MARTSDRASGDQTMASRGGAASSLIGPGSLRQSELAEDFFVRYAFATSE